MVSAKVRDWFKREYGYSLDEAFEMQKGIPTDRSDYSGLLNSRVPVEGVVSMQDIDSENSRLLDILTMPIFIQRR